MRKAIPVVLIFLLGGMFIVFKELKSTKDAKIASPLKPRAPKAHSKPSITGGEKIIPKPISNESQGQTEKDPPIVFEEKKEFNFEGLKKELDSAILTDAEKGVALVLQGSPEMDLMRYLFLGMRRLHEPRERTVLISSINDHLLELEITQAAKVVSQAIQLIPSGDFPEERKVFESYLKNLNAPIRNPTPDDLKDD